MEPFGLQADPFKATSLSINGLYIEYFENKRNITTYHIWSDSGKCGAELVTAVNKAAKDAFAAGLEAVEHVTNVKRKADSNVEEESICVVGKFPVQSPFNYERIVKYLETYLQVNNVRQ